MFRSRKSKTIAVTDQHTFGLCSYSVTLIRYYIFISLQDITTTGDHASHLSSHQIPLYSVKTTKRCLCVEVQVTPMLVTGEHTHAYKVDLFTDVMSKVDPQ